MQAHTVHGLRSPVASATPCAAERTAEVAATARQYARWLTGAALERLALGRGSPADKRDWSLARGSGPTLSAFAATHAGLTPTDAASARGLARALRDVRGLGAAVASGQISASDAARLGRVATRETAGAWLAAALATPPEQLGARLRAARPGDAPEACDPATADVGFGPLPDGRFRIATRVHQDPVAHLDFWTITRRHAERLVAMLKPRTPAGHPVAVRPGDVLAFIVRELAGGTGAEPPVPPVVPPARDWHVDPLTRQAWVQTGRGWFQVPGAALPRRRRGVRASVCTAAGEIVPARPADLLRAFPELAAAVAAPAVPALGAVEPDEPAPEDVAVGGDALFARLSASGPEDPALPLGLAALPPDVLRALAASGGRVSHALHALEVEARAAIADREGEAAAASRADAEAVRVGRALRDLPRLRAAFRAGRIGYEKVRLLTTRATPETEAAWLRLALRHDTAALTAWVVSRPRARRVGGRLVGPVAPAAPEGLEPLRPLGTRVVEWVEVDLSRDVAVGFAALRKALEAQAGCRLAPSELVARLAAWFLVRFPVQRTDIVVYHRSPDTRAAGTVPLHPRLRVVGDVAQRLRLAFRWLRPALDVQRPSRRACQPATVDCEPRPRAVPAASRYVRRAIHNAVWWRDGGKCITPGCGRDLTTQHDHFYEVHRGGTANAAVDHRLCGRCNRAKHLGEIVLVPGPDGTVRVLDRAGRRIGGVRFAPDWDARLLALCWRWAELTLTARTIGTSQEVERGEIRDRAPRAVSAAG